MTDYTNKDKKMLKDCDAEFIKRLMNAEADEIEYYWSSND